MISSCADRKTYYSAASRNRYTGITLVIHMCSTGVCIPIATGL